MLISSGRGCAGLLFGAVFLGLAAPGVLGQVEVIGTYYRGDQAFPQFNAFWHEGFVQPDEEAAGATADYAEAGTTAGKGKKNTGAGTAGKSSGGQPASGTNAKSGDGQAGGGTAVKVASATRVGATGAKSTGGQATSGTNTEVQTGKPHQNTGGQAASGTTADQPALAGSLHVFLRNGGSSAVKVDDALLSGLSLKESLAASGQRKVKKFTSIYFANLTPEQLKTLIADGEPVWWKVDPPEIGPGATAEVIVRLRSRPASASVPMGVKVGSQTIDAPVAVTEAAPRFEGISFGPNLKKVYLYLRHPTGAKPSQITIDGQDITAKCTISQDANVSVTPVVARLAAPLAAGSYHVFGAKFADGGAVMSGLRAWTDEFVYGVFGGKPGSKNDADVVGKQYIDDLTSHNLNLQMPQIGSAAVQEYFKSPQGKRYMASRGFRFVLSDPGKFGIADPYALYVHDEPDCGDFKAEGLPADKKVGALAQYCIWHGDEFRQAAPNVMQMLNLNMTFKPYNWYIYGQIPDIFTVDPYYQVRQKDAWYDHPERKGLYSEATYIYMVSSVAQSSCAPRPMHVILYGNQQTDKKDKNKVFRFPTPMEKRIEVYYALAAGAKSLSYWWYTPGGAANGLGAATSPKPYPAAQALWREIGLIGAEVRTAGPVLMTACPAELPVEAPENMWVRFLASGDDTLVMLAVNEQYRNTDKGTELTPVKDASVTVALPAWMQRAQAFEITAAGTTPLAAKAEGSKLRLPLGDFDATKIVVITADAKLRGRLQTYHGAKLAGNAAALLRR